ncbi:MAG: PKD domain-containing protein [Solirubrobacteraceae bacterium]
MTSTASSLGGGGSVVPVGPSAAFTWLPADPHVGQPVSLLSTSTAGSSALFSYAWQIDGGPFSNGPLARSVTFSTPGSHLVALRVTDAGGRSSLVSNTIPVSSREVTLMQPFPVVHVAGSYSHDGATLRMLSVQAPAGATVVVECSGTGCPARRQRRSVPTGDGAAATIGFAGFERSLPAGLTLKVKVFAEGEIGKLTRLVIRRGKPPARSDTCLEPSGLRATGCPA